ncbi:unnamed protein product, partial [Ectocarpus sp. 12 AP-2014]
MSTWPHGATEGDEEDAPFEDPEDVVGLGARRLQQRLPNRNVLHNSKQSSDRHVNQDEDPHNSRHKERCSPRVGKDGIQPGNVRSKHVCTCNLGLVGSERVRGRHRGVGSG